MVACEVCGESNFEKHAGFLYCAVCQTQSQEYLEQEYEFQESNVIRRKKTHRIQGKQKTYDDGVWTSLEAFNFILYGMTQEVKKYETTPEFEVMTLKLWAAYLRECNAGFISCIKESLPKLGFNFKRRDARVLYNVDMASNISIEKRGRSRSRSRSCTSKFPSSSITSLSSTQRSSLAHKRNKIIADDYQECLSLSALSSSNLEDETLESLGKSTSANTTEESSDENESFEKNFKKMLRKNDYFLYKNINNSQQLTMKAKVRAKRRINFIGKNKLLSIIHLSLLLIGSKVQLSDLLRFVREGQVSFAKVTHFFPNQIKFPKNDFSYIEVVSDSLMPTHLRQRQISARLATLLKIDKIFTPNLSSLVERYCHDLNLPVEMVKFSKRILANFVPQSFVPTSKNLIPSYEAWAIVSIIFVMKLLFGLNDRTEFFLSYIAREWQHGYRLKSVSEITVVYQKLDNRVIDWRKSVIMKSHPRPLLTKKKTNGPLLFVFEDWQKYIECRKAVLTDFHYPTEEQLNGDSFHSSKKFLDILMKESKDDYRNERFCPYPKYYMEEKLVNEVKILLSQLSKTHDVTSMTFKASLTPQMSHLQSIFSTYQGMKNDYDGATPYLLQNLLKTSFQDCDVEFAFSPENYLKFMDRESCISYPKFGINVELLLSNSSESRDSKNDYLRTCSSKYWILEYPEVSSYHLENFKVEVFEKMPENFQWLMTECARMLEMNVRDIYDELLLLEKRLIFEFRGRPTDK